MKYVELSGVLGDGTLKEVSKKELLQRASASPAVFNGLVEKRVFEVYHGKSAGLTVSRDKRWN